MILLLGGLQEHGDLPLDVGLSEDALHVWTLLRPLAQHTPDQLAQQGVVLTRHLRQLAGRPRTPIKNQRSHHDTLHYIINSALSIHHPSH